VRTTSSGAGGSTGKPPYGFSSTLACTEFSVDSDPQPVNATMAAKMEMAEIVMPRLTTCLHSML